MRLWLWGARRVSGGDAEWRGAAVPGVVPPRPVALGGPGRPTEPGRTVGRRPVHGTRLVGGAEPGNRGWSPRSLSSTCKAGPCVSVRPRTCPLSEPRSAPLPRAPAASAQTSAPA